ncbi:mitochondrial carrier [Heliocybe sulcata]|uniref:Mitochondrial carrier n=1 Tax=Heliocybe sulcata TaxID=5364 RepID=A0A5C3NHE9_9AGAM|nr:mitochondrial carrier [Heliocybe sulcata]
MSPKNILFEGALSGFASSICLQPLDLLKTRLQQGDHVRSFAALALNLTGLSRNRPRILYVARNVVASEGPLGLWRGTTATLARNVPGIAIYMTGLNAVRTALAKVPYFSASSPQSGQSRGSVLPKLNSQGNLLAGATTRVAAGFILNPFSVLKARFESGIYKYDSFLGSVGSIFRSGPSELLRGFTASALRDAPYAGLFVLSYEGLKREMTRAMPSASAGSSSLMHSAAAASASAFATLSTHPFDVIKTKVQVRSEVRYRGMLSTIKTILAQRGVAGFLDGVSLRIGRKVLSSAIGWTIYEAVLMFAASQKQP